MHRIDSSPRPGWQATVRAQGLGYADAGLPAGQFRSYWDESACYVLELPEVLRLEAVAEELHGMCVAAARYALAHHRYADFGVPDWAAPVLYQSLESVAPSLCGRLDLAYDGFGPPKLLDYRADTPTRLVEASIVQWYWLEATRPNQDQWNSLHERLVAAWRTMAGRLSGPTVHFGWSDLDATGEGLVNAGYLAETAHEAGLGTRLLPMRRIGWDGTRFVDDLSAPISTCFKLYPWEWMLREPYGQLALGEFNSTTWVEPPWKLLLGSNALPALLWELYPGHPNVLPAYLDEPRELVEYAVKPLADQSRRCYQQAVTPAGPTQVVVECWMVTDTEGRPRPAGAGFREVAAGGNGARERFIPHFVTR